MNKMIDSDKLNSNVKTDQLAQLASQVLSGRQSNLRAADEPPVFLERGQGQRVWDVDGRELVDFAIGMGPGIWGHNNSEYTAALHQQIDKLLITASGMHQTENEILLAQKIVEYVPCAQKVRFVTTGSEAVQMAIRLARAHTGKHLFIRFDGHYHGWIDNVLGGKRQESADAPPHATENSADPMHTEGRSTTAYQESFKLPWNDIDALRKVLEKYEDQIALVLMEGVMTNGGCCIPKPGYLQQVRELCTKHNVVFCMDEVITGFRMGLGGAQEHYNVVPDLATFGKAIAGGMPLAAVAGKAEIFELLRTNRVVGAGTFNAAPLSMSAGLATMQMLAKDGNAAYQRIDAMQTKFMSEFRLLALKNNQKVLVQGVRGVFCVHFTDLEVAWSQADLAAHADFAKSKRFRALLIEQGVYAGRGDRYFVSAGMSQEDLDIGLLRIDKALALLSREFS
ncbi:MAG: hypothetical protein RJB25_479 [Bacteroidota bacterium]|jgi:glutamate-1-semialdehyde 2,1-aminomutase